MDATSTLIISDTLHISSLLSPLNSSAPPAVKPRQATSRSTLRRRRRTRRRTSPSSDDSGGSFGGGGSWNFGNGGGGGPYWNEDWFSNYDDNNNNNNDNVDDPAFDFVYEVVCWIVFSNCLHFALKKVVRLVSEEREKVGLRIANVC